MSFPESTQLLLKAKKEKGLTFADIGNLLGLDEVWVASLFYGQSTASDEESDKLLKILENPKTKKEKIMSNLLESNLLIRKEYNIQAKDIEEIIEEIE